MLQCDMKPRVLPPPSRYVRYYAAAVVMDKQIPAALPLALHGVTVSGLSPRQLAELVVVVSERCRATGEMRHLAELTASPGEPVRHAPAAAVDWTGAESDSIAIEEPSCESDVCAQPLSRPSKPRGTPTRSPWRSCNPKPAQAAGCRNASWRAMSGLRYLTLLSSRTVSVRPGQISSD